MLILVAAGALFLWPRPPTIVPVKGLGGGSKSGLLADPDVQRILRERYRLAVDYSTSGSLVLGDCKDCDFLWPGNEADVERYRASHGGKVSYDKALQSPLVLYSWDEVTDALIKAGLVEREGDTYYLTDVQGFLTLNAEGKTWKHIGLPQIFGRAVIISADPTRADSGNTFAAYIATMRNQEQVLDRKALAPLLAGVREYFANQGYLQPKTKDLWDRYVTAGMGGYPIIVAYESLGIELIQLLPESERAEVLAHIRMIYPRPTVWFSHPLILVTARGKALADALKDPEIQAIAWKVHGFRSAVPGIRNDPQAVDFPGVAGEIISVMPLPPPDVLDRITEYLN